MNLGQIVGCLVGGFCGGRWGPRTTVLWSCLPACLAWLGLSLAPSLPVLLASRVCCGLAGSLASANCALLVAQYSSDRRRGAWLSLFALMVGLGILLCYSLGAGLAWRWVAAVPPLLYTLLAAGLARLPESPVWLLGHRGPGPALAGLAWLRGPGPHTTEELARLQQTMEQQQGGLTLVQAVVNLRRQDVRTPFLIILTNFFFVMLSGPFAIIFYGVEIFQDVPGLKGKERQNMSMLFPI